MGRSYLPIMTLETLPDLGRMTLAKILLLVTELWDDLATHPAEIPVSRAQIAEFDRSMADYRKNPS